ncbi:MAG: hypothetical protein ABIZ81_10725 [Opitutaceae bacterium]
MKTNLRQFLLVSITLAASAVAFAAKPIAGPKGGKILTAAAPHAEFFVEKNRTVTITFYDANLKPVAPAGQVITGVAEAKTGKVGLEFATKGGALVSNIPLPAGDDYQVVLQVRDTASARPKIYRVQFDAAICGECKRAEYACICHEHGVDETKK